MFLKRYFTALFSLLGMLLIHTSCVDNDFSTGQNLFEDKTKSVIIDSCSVNLSTVLTDTVRTSGLGKVFFGQYSSSDMGKTSAHSYISFSRPTMTQSSDFDADSNVKIVIDSVSFVLIYDDFRYGDSTQVQTMEISLLSERLDELYAQRGNAFFNNNTASTSSTVYQTVTFRRPGERAENDSTLYIKLPDAFGQEIIDSLRAQSDYMTSDERFYQFFKGFRLSPGANDNACLNAFKVSATTAPVIRIYYHSIDDVPTEQMIEIRANTTYAFSNISRDHSNSLLQSLKSTEDEISSTSTGHKAFIQGLGGYSARLTFPTVPGLSQLGKRVSVVSALLYVYPAQDTYNEFFPLPSQIQLNFLNKLGDVKDIIVDPSSSLTNGVLLEDSQVAGRFYYVFDITSYISSQIGALPANLGTLQFSISDASSINTLGSLTIGDSNYPNIDYRTKLTLQLLIYDYE